MVRILTKDIASHEDKQVLLSGWVAARRNHGKIIFIDIRDRGGVAQLVFIPSNKEVYAKAEALRSEWVITVKGLAKRRPKGMENPNLSNGEFEVPVDELTIEAEAKTPPISVDTDGYDIGEDSRMKYRYLDLRRARLAKNMRNRAKMIQFIREFLSVRDFAEIETPVLSKSTPEGARDYLVPSRLYHGKFYALPQSPQQYKQLLMVAGLERYFQIARCFRDEDTRGDRQPEFTQLDLEMSFVKRGDVMDLNEELLTALVEKLYPNKRIQEKPFPRLTYKEAVEKYGVDGPDLRKDKDDQNLLAFCWVIDFPFFERATKGSGSTGSPQTSKEVWTFTHNPFSAPKPEDMEKFMKGEDVGGILTTQYDVVLNGFEIGGGSIRNHEPGALKQTFKIMGFAEERIMNNFGHMIEALSYGAPPHGGIAWGLDRVVALLESEPNIREVIAFPKTGDGRDLMMEAPSEVDKEQLKELGLKIDEKKASK